MDELHDVRTRRHTHSTLLSGGVAVLLTVVVVFVTSAPSTAVALVAAVGEMLASPGGLFFIAGLLLALVAGYQLLPIYRDARSRSHQR